MALKFTFDNPLKNCPVCEDKKIDVYQKIHDKIIIDRCKSCGSKFMNPRPTDAYLNSFYSTQHIREKNHLFDNPSYHRKAKKHELNMRFIEKCLGGKGLVISIGCGSGTDILTAKEMGWDVEGYEVNQNFVNDLNQNHNIKMYSGEFSEISFKEMHYDAVYLHQVLEHPKNPGLYLDIIYKLLKPGGVLFIACPNIVSIGIKIKRLLDLVGFSSRKGKFYESEKHLTYFNPRKLANYLKKRYKYKVIYLGNDFKIDPVTLKPNYSFQDKINILGKSSFRLFLKKV